MLQQSAGLEQVQEPAGQIEEESEYDEVESDSDGEESETDESDVMGDEDVQVPVQVVKRDVQRQIKHADGSDSDDSYESDYIQDEDLEARRSRKKTTRQSAAVVKRQVKKDKIVVDEDAEMGTSVDKRLEVKVSHGDEEVVHENEVEETFPQENFRVITPRVLMPHW